MFQSYSLKSSHSHLPPQSTKVCSLHLCLFCYLAQRVIVTIFLSSIYICVNILYWCFSFLGDFFITASISMLVIGLFIISISSWFSLGRLNFSKNLFLPDYLFYCHMLLIIVSYNSLYFCIVCYNFFFISNFVDSSLFFS